MRRTRVALFVHLVWATWDRLPLLTGERERRVYRCIEDVSRELEAEVLALGGVQDHVHVVVRLPATLAVADLVQRIKGASSHLATHEADAENVFKWQGGYCGFTVSQRGVAALCTYVNAQQEHHGLSTTIAAYEPELDPPTSPRSSVAFP